MSHELTETGSHDLGRVALERITPELAARIIRREERPGDAWHPEYPFADELVPLRVLAAADSPDPVFTMYAIRQAAGGLAVGGLGFLGPPDADGAVGLGYGLVPAARGAGLATEAVRGALRIAEAHGALEVRADTTTENVASQCVLEKAGFEVVRQTDTAVFYRRLLTPSA
ncbi:GNAT family N-acetyltransferase [Zhihengliuella sp. ISTPL4]|uniref:GNAT family N-acetyltransferase n=1 Tax=Zhihengliuella sp. ISTPL4 TaxID=2058657 RepID=UPI000C7DE21C|nr:GNAT family N-acetyltransferase [Zhihengliuella sp. ISTPL4]